MTCSLRAIRMKYSTRRAGVKPTPSINHDAKWRIIAHFSRNRTDFEIHRFHGMCPCTQNEFGNGWITVTQMQMQKRDLARALNVVVVIEFTDTWLDMTQINIDGFTILRSSPKPKSTQSIWGAYGAECVHGTARTDVPMPWISRQWIARAAMQWRAKPRRGERGATYSEATHDMFVCDCDTKTPHSTRRQIVWNTILNTHAHRRRHPAPRTGR